MNTKAPSQLESMLHLGKTLSSVEEDRLLGEKGFSIDDIDEMMRNAIWEVATDGQDKRNIPKRR